MGCVCVDLYDTHTQEPCPYEEALQILFTAFASERTKAIAEKAAGYFFLWRLH
jgi:hypothetical protein